MKNFFLPKAGMPEGAQRKITAHPGAVDFNLDGAFGWVVEETQLEEVLKLLGAEKFEEKATSLEGIFSLSLSFNAEQSAEAPAQKNGEVKILSWDGSGQDRFKKALAEILLPVLQGKGVEVSVPHKNVEQPRETEDFQIFIWSSKSGQATVKPPVKIWEHDVACRDEAFPGTGEGMLLIDESTGYVVAELLGDNILYVHHDLVHHGDESEEKIFRHLLQVVVEELTLSPAEKASRETKRAEEAAKRNRDAYVAECHKRFEKTLSGTRDAIKQGHDRIAQLQAELVKTIRETQGKEQKLEQLQSAQGDQLERYGLEYDRLFSVEKVKSVRVSDGEVKVFTDVLFCTDPRSGLVHEIGAFEIRIPTNGSGGVRWFNLTRRIDGYRSDQNAPHIWSDGSACLGNTQEIFPELIANYEFATVAMVAIQFVESVNTDDQAGKHISNWPVAEKIS